MNFQMFKLVLDKAEEQEIKLPTSTGSRKKQESSRKTSISALLTMPKPLTVWITTNYGKYLEMGISDHLTCLLKNLYAGQKATVRTVHGTTDWFQIGKGVRQGCILSPCLFNLYAELDTTEQLHFHFSLSYIGEGNGNLLQCSCLENPRDRGAWRAAVYGVSQSRTRLKQLSSSSSKLWQK